MTKSPIKYALTKDVEVVVLNSKPHKDHTDKQFEEVLKFLLTKRIESEKLSSEELEKLLAEFELNQKKK